MKKIISLFVLLFVFCIDSFGQDIYGRPKASQADSAGALTKFWVGQKPPYGSPGSTSTLRSMSWDSLAVAMSRNTAFACVSCGSIDSVRRSNDSVYVHHLAGNWAFAFIDSVGSGTSGWSLTGNSGTDPATNFIGTTDTSGVNISRNSTPYIKITNIGLSRNAVQITDSIGERLIEARAGATGGIIVSIGDVGSSQNSTHILIDDINKKIQSFDSAFINTGLFTNIGSVTIQDGTQQNGYVFTSDANGLGSWKSQNLDTILTPTGQDTIADGYTGVIISSTGGIAENIVLPANPYEGMRILFSINDGAVPFASLVFDGNGYAVDANTQAVRVQSWIIGGLQQSISFKGGTWY